MKRFILLAFVLGLLLPLSAQQVSGRLVATDQSAVPYANVVLQHPDSTFVSGATTDDRGVFAVQAPEAGDYLLSISYIGYETLYINLNHLQGKMKLGNITLTEAAKQMGEVVVTGSNTVRRVDRQLVVPSQTQTESSATSYELLGKLMLPGLLVDPLQNKVSTLQGGEVEIRINDIKASQGQLLSLNPKQVLRVEYIDNPGVRYGDTDVAAVINYVMKQREAGVEGSVFGRNALTYIGSMGDENLSVYANKGKSEFGLDYNLSRRDYDHRSTNETAVFNTGDGTQRQRIQEGIETPFSYTVHTLEASYTWNHPDKFLFRALFSDQIYRSPNNDAAGVIRETGQSDLYAFTHHKTTSQTPSLDLYAAWDLKHHQKLMLNAVGTYIGTDYLRDYQESDYPGGGNLRDYAYTTDGDRYSLIGEGIYRKSWEKTALSIGAKGMQAYTHNVYTGSTNAALNQHSSSFYGYAELQGNLDKLNYQVGAGLSQDKFSESNEGYSFVTFRPRLSLYLPLGKSANVRYTFRVSPTTPTLSQLSGDVEQQISEFEIRKGNKDLQPYRRYFNQLSLGWNKGRVGVQLNGNYNYYRNPIMGEIIRKGTGMDALFYYTSENQDNYSELGATLNISWRAIPDKLNFSASGQATRYHTEGPSYTHNYNAYRGTFSADYTQGPFTYSMYLATRNTSLWGELISYGETTSILMVSYRIKKLMLGLGWMYPLQPREWRGGSRRISDLVSESSWSHIKENSNMIMFTLYWRFNSGRSFDSGRKDLNNSDHDSGIVM